ncbi:MAG: helix-turn-helix transcriptional regulator [Clostridia bacterium]|nr:helix-turn-helix transcriptional regulator [Clostridia bacterium]
MKIIFAQNRSEASGLLKSVGISHCYLKHIFPEQDQRSATNKWHHHTGFEIHIIEKGSHTYECEDEKIMLKNGEFLLIPPFKEHRITATSADTNKYAITFSVDPAGICAGLNKTICGKIPQLILENLELIDLESTKKNSFYNSIIESRILECIYLFLRFSGIDDTQNIENNETEDYRFALAAQYISDNICKPVTVNELAVYSALSCRQLARVFENETGLSTSEYIKKERCKHIESLLATSELSLKQISELMNFENEYYFNAFFKKYSGMTPGSFRKSIKR